MNTQDIIQIVDKEKVIAIIRGVSPEQCLKVADALYEGGIRLMEIAYNQQDPSSFPNTADCIESIGSKYEGRMLVGAGTVVSTALTELSAKAGAKYIISPDVNVDVIRRTKELGMVSMPGALTPTEIMTAHAAGADYVKLFPAGNFGPAYVKAIRAPISHVKMMAVGGINEKNLADYLKVGMSGAGIGGNLANKEWIEKGDFMRITEVARMLVDIAKQF